MAELNDLAKTILDRISDEEREKIKEHSDKNMLAYQSYERGLILKFEDHEKSFEEKSSNQFDQDRQHYRNVQRNEVLKVQEESTKNILQEVKNELEKMNSVTFKSLLNEALKEVNTDQPFTLQLGEHSQTVLTTNEWQELLKEYPSLSLKEELVLSEGGFQLDQAGMTVNYLSSVLVDESSQELKSLIIRNLSI